MAGTATGVFIGMSHDDYAMVTSDAGAFDQAYAFTGNPFSMASGRIAHALGLHGPALTMDTACSSSMVAVHQACRSLHDGESDMALAGGVMLMLDQRLYASASGQGMLSPTGRCHAFDVEADGFVRAEGCGVVMLKRLDDAQRDGDRVLAVIRGTASNQDGRTDNILTPSGDAQVAVFRAALDSAGVDPATVGMVEAHGTGTPVGDTIEYTSVSTVYGHDGPLRADLGEEQLRPRRVRRRRAGSDEGRAVGAPRCRAEEPALQPASRPPGHDRDRVVRAAGDHPLAGRRPRRPAPCGGVVLRHVRHQRARRAGAGARAAPPTAARAGPPRPTNCCSRCPRPRPTNCGTPRGGWPTGSTAADEDLDTGRPRLHAGPPPRAPPGAHGRHRRQTARPWSSGLRAVADGDDPFQAAVGQDDRGPVWVFSGQGSQWATMGVELMDSEPVFAATIAELEPMIAAESGFSVTEAMLAPETVTGIDRIQPTIFAMQVAMAATMKSYGVTPGAVIGHSLGEVAAAVVSGALSLADGVKVICRRSLLCLKIAGGGAMAAVELPAQQVREELGAPGHRGRRRRRGGLADLDGDRRCHRHRAPHRRRRGSSARSWPARWRSTSHRIPRRSSRSSTSSPGCWTTSPHWCPEVPYYSATLFDPREQPYCDVDYWMDNLRHTVRFSAAVQAALEDGFRVFAELSPHPLLVRAVEQTAATLDIPVAALAGMRRGQEMPHGLRTLVADLFAAGAAVDFAALLPDRSSWSTPRCPPGPTAR